MSPSPNFTVAVSDGLHGQNNTPSISRSSSRLCRRGPCVPRVPSRRPLGPSLPPRRGQIKSKNITMIVTQIEDYGLWSFEKMISSYMWETAIDQDWTTMRKHPAKMVSTVAEEMAEDPDLTTIMEEMAEDEVLTPPCSSTRESPTPLAPTQPTLIVEERLIQSLQCSTDIAADLAPGSSLEEERSVAMINPSVPARSPLHHETEPNGGELMQLVRPKQLSLVEFDATKYGENVVSADQSCTVICHSEKKITGETLERKCPRTECLISSEDRQQHFGWKHVDAAESFGVSASPVNHICRQLGNQMLGGSTSSHEELLQVETRFLRTFGRGSNGSKMENRSKNDCMVSPPSHHLCHGNDPARDLFSSSTCRESLEAGYSSKLAFQLTEPTPSAAYSTPSALVVTKPQFDLGERLSAHVVSSKDLNCLFPSAAEAFLEGQIPESTWTESPCSDPALKEAMATVPTAVPDVMTNINILTASQTESEKLMIAPCWSSTTLLAPTQATFMAAERTTQSLQCLTESTAQDNLAQFVRTPQPATSRPHHEAEPNGEELTKLALSKKGHLVEFDPTNYRQNVVNVDQSSAAISHSKNKNIRETLERKRGRTENSISLDVIYQHAGMKLQEAAERLEVSRSTLKRICRKNGIQKWPLRKIKKDTPSTSKQASATVTDCPCDQALATVAHTEMQDVDMVTVKAKHVNQIIKFQLSFSSGLVELQRQVAKRLNIEGESYYIKYEDEDKDLISIACDEDLQHYIGTRKSLDSTSIRVLLEPK